MIKKDSELYIFKDPDGYFMGIKGTSIVKKITRQEYQQYKLVYEERYFKKGEDEDEETNSNDTNRNNIFSWMHKKGR